MSDRQDTETAQPESDLSKITPAKPASDEAANVPTAVAKTSVKALTAEEQMALFEKDLKENDWGHQPC